MAAVTTDRRYRIPEWIHLENLAIRTLEVHTGVKIRIPKLWLVYNYGKPIGYGDRIVYSSPRQYMRYYQNGKWYYEEDYYEFCQYGKDEVLDRPTPVLKHQCRIYPGKPYSDIIDCSWLHTRQFYRWNPELQIISPNPDNIFKSKPMLVLDGLYDQHGWPYVYITRENMWDFKSYWFYPAVWVFQPYLPKKQNIFNPNEIPKRHATTKLHYRFLDTVEFVKNGKMYGNIGITGVKFHYMGTDGGERVYQFNLGDLSRLRHTADLYEAFHQNVKNCGNTDLWIEIGDEFQESYYLDERVLEGCEINICATDGTLTLLSDKMSDCFTGNTTIPEHAIVSVTSEYIGSNPNPPDSVGNGGQTPPSTTNPVEYEWMCKGPLPPKQILQITVGNVQAVQNGYSPFQNLFCDRVNFYWYDQAMEPAKLITLNIPKLSTMTDADALERVVNNALAAKGMRNYFEFRYLEYVPVDGNESVLVPQYGLYCTKGRIGPYSSFGEKADFFSSSDNIAMPAMYLRAIPVDSQDLPTPLNVSLTLNNLDFDVENDTATLKGRIEGTVTAYGTLTLLFPDGEKMVVEFPEYRNYWLFEIPFPLNKLAGGNVLNAVATVKNNVGETATAAQDIPYDMPPSRDIRIIMEPLDILGDNELSWMEFEHGIGIFVRGIVTGADARLGMEVMIELPSGYKEKTYLGYNENMELFFSLDFPAEFFAGGTFVKAYIVEEVNGEKLIFTGTVTYELNLNPPFDYLTPCLPMFMLYPHDSYSQFDDASLESLPFRFDIPPDEWKRDYEEKK